MKNSVKEYMIYVYGRQMIDGGRDYMIYHKCKSQGNSKSKDKLGRDLKGQETVR